MRRGVVSVQVRGWHRTYTRSTASLALKDVPIGVRCGIVLGVKTPSFDGSVERRGHLFLSSRQMDIIVHMDDVVEFIRRRFPQDCNWLNGNCFFFAKILQSRFQNGIVLYDVIDGHFVLKIGDLMYDWRGLVEDDGQRHEYVEWDKFAEYDSLQKARIVRDCIM